MTHDYKCHGTTTLFAALDVKSGKVVGDCMPRHRAREFLQFLRQIDKAVSARRDVHLVLDSEPVSIGIELGPWIGFQKGPLWRLVETGLTRRSYQTAQAGQARRWA